ncbi:hypothetical protein Clacol_010578 [Clathrus columnatus]|nr:hypothetical protein Clacol_010578 [Clathrus columnatus]
MYFCLTCLENVDAKFWAGNTDEFPALFNEAQVNTIMNFLQSPDHILRLQTYDHTQVLWTLKKVDKTILLGYLTQLMLNIPSSTQFHLEVTALEVASVYEEEGQPFATRLKEVCSCLAVSRSFSEEYDERKLNKIGISQGIIEVVLLHLRTGHLVSDSFRGQFVDEIMRTPLSEIGSTLSLIIAAATYEYGQLSSLTPFEQLRKLVDIFILNIAVIQEPLLLAMLRVTAREETVPSDVVEKVHDLHHLSKSLIKKLPEFLTALESTEKTGESIYVNGPYRDNTRTASPPVSKGKLRYEAYEAPRPTPKQSRPRNLSRDTSFVSSPRDITNTPSMLALSPGHLALAVYQIDLSKGEIPLEIGSDLITLDPDSPFLIDPMIPQENTVNADTENFDDIWHTLKDCPSTRGWSEREIDQIVAPFRSIFEGEYDMRVYHLDKGKFIKFYGHSGLTTVFFRNKFGGIIPSVWNCAINSIGSHKASFWRRRNDIMANTMSKCNFTSTVEVTM